jgi:phosphate starvation-inducible PhoH-like protein
MARQTPKKKTSRRVSSYNNEENTRSRIVLTAKTDTQKSYIDALRKGSQVITCGPAGTGKTYIAATVAAQQYQNRSIEKIVITRPHVAVGNDIGFLPGNLQEKTTPWALPVLDVLQKHLGSGAIETGLKNGNIECCPLALIRGRSFDKAFIILDEAQNLTVDEVKALLTRVGEGSTVVLNGDLRQSDIKEHSGLDKVIHLSKKHCLPIPVIEFGIEDCVRSDICKQWIEVFTKEGL